MSLGDNVSVTIIATGFQTKEEREQTKQSAPKKQFLTLDTPLIKPINEFSKKVFDHEENANIPVLKSDEITKPQVDLFADMFNSKSSAIEEEKIEEPSADLDGFEFNLKISESEFSTPVAVEEMVEEVIAQPVNLDEGKTDESMEEQLRKSKERILRLKDLSMKLRSTSGLQELENEPAYKRKQFQLKDVPHSSESQISRFTLSNEDGQTEIRPNNSFLHDNVD
jgi:cell division protein FtsZ